MNILNSLRPEEKRNSLYLILGIAVFVFFDYSIAHFFHNINYQTKSLFETLTHFGDSLYFFVPTILIWCFVKIFNNKNPTIKTFGDISIFIFLTILLSGSNCSNL